VSPCVGPRRWQAAGQKGQSLVEMAIVAPLLVTLLLGIAELGWALNACISITNAAREGARLAARGNTFAKNDILSMVELNSIELPLSTPERGWVFITVATSTTTTLTTVTTKLTGDSSKTSRIAEIVARRNVGNDPNLLPYMLKEQFVVVEVFYEHRALTGFLGGDIPMYSYSVMPISAPF
jgi:hypothetical protein